MKEVKVLQLTAPGEYRYAHEINGELSKLYKDGFTVKATFLRGHESYAILDRDVK